MKTQKRRKDKVWIRWYIVYIIICALFVSSIIFFRLPQKLFIKQKMISPVVQSIVKLDLINELKILLDKNSIGFSSIAIASDSSYLIILKDDSEVFFSSRKSIPSQVSSLQFLLSRLTIEGKRVNRLDFRFDKPIIVYR